MTIWTIIKRFQYKQFWQLFILSIKYPLFVYPTLKATAKSFQTAKKEFPKTHGNKGRANAFRHAFWNAYVCFECNEWSKNKNRVLDWTKLITDKHEELSPNAPLDQHMDLHNNKIGRNLFITSGFKNKEEIIEGIKIKLASAKKIKTIKNSELHPLELVYISDE